MNTHQSKKEEKKILDACCGGKMFWFDRNHPNTLYVDNRKMHDKVIYTGKDGKQRKHSVKPDIVADFRNLPFKNKSFNLVVFDPPHLYSLGEKSWMRQKYGALNKETWREYIEKGFSECFRVLKNDGVLIFKWNEYDILLKEILKLTPHRPLFGHPSGKLQKTHWVCFMKLTS